ncbi:uncharacterized protein [Palaemon carinicauda]|uniref:uncharacterized protein n=1 Tax=Palaemon carinicauda TaxID=392227 RepID=UPI0035B57DD1
MHGNKLNRELKKWACFGFIDVKNKDRLYSLASGSPTSKDVERDVLEADAVGKAAKADFITRLQSGHQGSFFDPIKRKKLKTMEACNKKIKLTSSQGKVIQYQEQSNVAFLLLVKSQCLDEPIDLDELMKYSLMPVPPSIGTSDGFFAKTNKATILHYLMEEFNQDELPYPKDALFIQDGMALLHVLSNLPPTCGEICLQILDQMIAKKHFLFSTDSYFPGSIKAQERLRRGRVTACVMLRVGFPCCKKESFDYPEEPPVMDAVDDFRIVYNIFSYDFLDEAPQGSRSSPFPTGEACTQHNTRDVATPAMENNIDYHNVPSIWRATQKIT